MRILLFASFFPVDFSNLQRRKDQQSSPNPEVSEQSLSKGETLD